MKILWFTNSPSLAKEKLNQVTYGGGWMESLQEKIQVHPKISLALSFYSQNSNKFFIQNNTHYYPLEITERKNRISRYIARIRHKIEDESIEIEKYLKVIELFKPDIIHIFGTEKPFGLIADKVNIPVIIWIQGNIIVYKQKWFTGLTKQQVSKNSLLKNKIKGFGLYHAFPAMEKVALREEKIFKNCKYFFGRTDFDRRITKILAPNAEYFHCEEMLRSHFYNYKFTANKSSFEEFKIISVLNPDIYKGFETIFQTMALLKTNYSKLRIKWQIVGIQGNEEIIKLVEKQFGFKAKDVNIEYTGKLKSDALVSKLLESDLFIHPSHIENSPNSICEAMILGMPIICTYVGGVSSLIENKKEGIVVQDGDHYTLAGAIVEVIENYSNALKCGIVARERALARHNPDQIINNLLNIYKEISNEHS